MIKTTCRAHALAALHVLVLGPALALPVGSVDSKPVIDSIDADEIELFEELGEWLDESSSRPQIVRTNIREKADSFELFRNLHDSDGAAGRLSVPFGELIRQAAERQDLDVFLVAAVIEAESGFDSTAVSARGAVGLMQVMPTTAAVPADALTDPQLNLELGTAYLKQLLDLYSGDLELALAAYNAGPAAVRRFDGMPPFSETRSFVEKVLQLYVAHHRQVWQTAEVAELLAP